jgi:hypothetical protein
MRLNSGLMLQEYLQTKYIQDNEKIANYMLYIIMGSLIINTLGTIAKIIMIVVALPLIALIWLSGSTEEDYHSEKAAEAFLGMLLAGGLAVVTGLNLHYGWVFEAWPRIDCGAVLCVYLIPILLLVLACMAGISMFKELRY